MLLSLSQKISAISLFIALCVTQSCHQMGGVVHSVDKGETLYSISHRYEVDLNDIEKANPRVDYSRLSVGQKILIPGALLLKSNDQSRVIENTIESSETKKNSLNNQNISLLKKSQSSSNKKNKLSDKSKSKNIKNKAQSKKNIQLNFMWPCKGKVIAQFGLKNKKMHNGIDILLKAETEIKSAEAGKVVYAANSLKGYGNMIIIKHSDKIFTVYAHLGVFSVDKNTEVKKGAVIAKSNKHSSNSFIHFEIRKAKQALNPTKHLIAD